MSQGAASSAHTRQALLEAARALFSSRGYAAVGIREIAESAGANIASINYYFGSKRALYLEMVREAMTDAEQHSPWAVLRMHAAGVPDAETAAGLLARFVHGYLAHLYPCTAQTAGATVARPVCGRLMLWEAVNPSEAIDDVVREYVAPGNEMLHDLVAPLLPGADSRTVRLHARSILGQIMHYLVFDPFIGRLDGAAGDPISHVADHIVRFSLRAMSYEDAFIDRVLRQASIASSTQETTP